MSRVERECPRTVFDKHSVIVCDGPECEVEVPEDLSRDLGFGPDGWLVAGVIAGGYPAPQHFHQSACLIAWVHALLVSEAKTAVA